MQKRVLIISTLDTKSAETEYLKMKLSSIGLDTLVMDLSMGGEGLFAGDITPRQVAEAGGSSLEAIWSSRERAKITAVIIAGASRLAGQFLTAGKIDGVVGVGGSTGSLMATEVMRTLPFGLPKLMISSTAALPGLSTRYIGTGDISLFHSVVEISGVSDLLKNVFDRAAFAMAGMVSEDITPPRAGKGKAIAMTMLGPCEKCASLVRIGLEQAGYQVIGFSAAGIGDRAMETMIAEGLFHGVIDLAPGGVGEHLFGYMRDAGPNRMESAGLAGIPQVISSCSVNHMTPSKSKYKPDFDKRRKYDLDKYRAWLRLNPDELKAVAEIFAEKLNLAKGPVKMIIPQKGWSGVDRPGQPTYDPAEDRVFIDTLKARLNPQIEILEVDANMEEPQFAQAVINLALKIL